MRGTDDQTAFAVPRIALGTTAEVALPQPLSPSDAALVRQIFALQASGALAEAARDTNRLDSNLLLGPILADRYLGGRMRPTAAELTDWLRQYGDQPDAPAIRALLARLQPDSERVPVLPPPSRGPSRIASRAAAPGMARPLFVENRDAAAVAAAFPLLAAPPSRPGSADPLLAGGLAAWRLGQMRLAGEFFAATWRAAPDDAVRAAGAYWAARTAQRQADHSEAVVWLRRAARESHTFYGRIAGRVLRPSLACGPAGTLGIADIDALAATQEGRRAFALLQVGQKPRAEAELRELWEDSERSASLARTLALLAQAIDLPGFAADLRAVRYTRPDGPMPPTLHPADGFVVNPPLVYALVHHESDFHAGAVSRDGARGLMQIKPTTARVVAGTQWAERLHDPAVNVAIGQRYLLHLASDDGIDGDLIRLLAAYTEGPSAVRLWADRVNSEGDPLLFIEAIPKQSTKGFVQDTLAWSWHYAAMFGQPAASLDALAGGQFPRLVRARASIVDVAATGCGVAATR